MQLVVVMAVKKAVSAATTTFTAISMNLFFIVIHYSLFTVHYSLFTIHCSLFTSSLLRLVFVEASPSITTFTAGVDHEA